MFTKFKTKLEGDTIVSLSRLLESKILKFKADKELEYIDRDVELDGYIEGAIELDLVPRVAGAIGASTRVYSIEGILKYRPYSVYKGDIELDLDLDIEKYTIEIKLENIDIEGGHIDALGYIDDIYLDIDFNGTDKELDEYITNFDIPIKAILNFKKLESER